VLNKEKALHPPAASGGVFVFHLLAQASLARDEKQKPRRFRARAFSL
jgi:hypothetical protein